MDKEDLPPEIIKEEPKRKKKNSLIRFTNGLILYFKEYILLLKNGTFTVLKIFKYCSYRYGFETLVILSCLRSYSSIVQTQKDIGVLLVKGGEL